MAKRAKRPALSRATRPDEGPSPRGLALGLLAMAPLFAAYEIGVARGGPDGPRNFAELLLGRLLLVFGSYEGAIRIAILAVLIGLAFAQARLAGVEIGRTLLRVPLEGALFGLALGPLLVFALAAIGIGPADLGLPDHTPEVTAELDRALRAFGAGAWEELVFRVGAYSACFVLAGSVAHFFGANAAWMRGLSEAFGAIASALIFAACHLEQVMGLVGLRGEPFDAGVFLWRVLAGLFLAGLFRLRGPGVAAWCHGLFNLALLLGAGPGVFR